jgi:hypothetical protein
LLRRCGQRLSMFVSGICTVPVICCVLLASSAPAESADDGGLRGVKACGAIAKSCNDGCRDKFRQSPGQLARCWKNCDAISKLCGTTIGGTARSKRSVRRDQQTDRVSKSSNGANKQPSGVLAPSLLEGGPGLSKTGPASTGAGPVAPSALPAPMIR